MSEEEIEKIREELKKLEKAETEQATEAIETEEAREETATESEETQPQAAQIETETVDRELEEIERFKRTITGVVEGVKPAVELAKLLEELKPEEKAYLASLLDKLLSREERKEKPRVITMQTPTTITIPREVGEALRRTSQMAESALTKIAETEERLSRLEKALETLAETQREISFAIKSVTSTATETARLGSEIAELREELKRMREEREKMLMILPRAEKTADGRIIEYEPHPALKAMEKRVDFEVNKLLPSMLEELRLTRADISASINRIASLIEAIITPELRRRAPKLVEDIEETMRRLVGRLTPEERVKELKELEEKIQRLEGGGQ